MRSGYYSAGLKDQRQMAFLAPFLQIIVWGGTMLIGLVALDVYKRQRQYPADDPAICAAWQAHYDSDSDAPKQQCLVTGELDEIAAVHPAIKGVRDAQSSGCLLYTSRCV